MKLFSRLEKQFMEELIETNAALLMLWATGETALEARVKRRQEALALAAQDD